MGSIKDCKDNEGHTKKIIELYAIIDTNDIGGEGIIGFSPDRGKTHLAMVGADMTRVESLKQLLDSEGIPYRILHFKLVGEI